MRLPDSLYHAVRQPFAHYAGWKFARLPPARTVGDERETRELLRKEFPDAIPLDRPGCGEQFLRFHRDMVRQMKWLAAQTPGHSWQYTPWPVLPDWLRKRLGETFTEKALSRIDYLVKHGTADALGNFIESTERDQTMFRDLHKLAHVAAARHESDLLGSGDPRLVDARMDFSSTAPHNTLFWNLHGWIDQIFARWQELHDEPADHSPLQPFTRPSISRMTSAMREQLESIAYNGWDRITGR